MQQTNSHVLLELLVLAKSDLDIILRLLPLHTFTTQSSLTKDNRNKKTLTMAATLPEEPPDGQGFRLVNAQPESISTILHEHFIGILAQAGLC